MTENPDQPSAPEGVDPSAISEPAPEKPFEQRFADGSGGGDWYMTDEDRYINERYQSYLADGHDTTTAMNMARQDLEQWRATRPATDPAEPSGMEPQALSQPGPTEGTP